jgi:hypothetical protein
MSNLGCAQDADGNLLSPSKIKWYNDIDDVNPILESGGSPTPSPAASRPAPSSFAKPTTLDGFFYTSGNPIITPADSRRSHRATRPSIKNSDPNNTAAPTFVASSSLKLKPKPKPKLKAGTKKSAPKISRLRKVFDSDDDAAGTATEGGDNVDEAIVEVIEKADSGGEDTEIKYMSTKALGDADHEVSDVFIFARRYTGNFCI